MILDFLPKQQTFLEDVSLEKIFSGGYGAGKAQPLYSKILTPNGWTTFKDIKINDVVMSYDGKPTKVIDIFPQGIKEVFEITLSDGSKVQSTDEHLWKVWTNKTKTRNKPDLILSLSDIRKNYIQNDGYSRYFLPLVNNLEFEYKECPIDPYLLGLLLGDGGIKYKSIIFTTSDEEFLNYIKVCLPENTEIIKIANTKFGYRIRKTSSLKNDLMDLLKSLNLMGKDSENKFIPDIYKYNTIRIRLEILRGLFDTDGWLSGESSVGYCTISKKLSEDVAEIVYSLGGRCNISEKIPSFVYKGEKRIGKLAYNLYISLPSKYNPFRLKRKSERWIPHAQREPTRAIREIKSIGFQECKCIKIENPDGLYITDNYIITHNSITVCTQLLLLSLRYPNNRIFLGRKFLQALKSTTLKTLLQGDGDFPPVLPENLIKNHNKTDRVISLINNSEIIYGNVDIEQIKSLNLGGVAIDECGELSQEEWDALSGRLRLSGIPYRPIFGATNPYPESHWIWNRFMVNQPKNDKGESTVHLFQSATYENFHLPQTYIDNLKRTLFGHYYLRYVDGLWVGADKLVFDNYDPKLHIIPAERCFEIPKTWKRYRAVDFGYRSPFSCGWFTIVPEDDSDLGLKEGDVILYREIYMTQRTSGINAQQVKNASVYSDGTPEIIQWTVCDWDAGDKADLEAVGIKTINATKTDKPFRIQKVRARLGNNDPSKGSIIKPRFFIFENSLVELDRKIRFNMDTGQTNNDPTCAKEEFLTYSWKPLKNSGGNEEPEDKFDHAMDMINYFINKLDSGGGWKDIEFKKI